MSIQSTESTELDKALVDVLVKIAFADTSLELEEIALAFNISKPKAHYYVDELLEQGLITSMQFVSGYGVTKKGRKFLFDRNLI